MMPMDPIFWLLLLPGLLLGMYAQMRLTSTYNRFVRQGIATGMTGAQAAREILDRAGLHNMAVNMVLETEELDAGYILMCQSRPLTEELELEVLDP